MFDVMLHTGWFTGSLKHGEHTVQIHRHAGAKAEHLSPARTHTHTHHFWGYEHVAGLPAM